MKQFFAVFFFVSTLCGFAYAQAVPSTTSFARQQVTIDAGGSFTRKVTDSGITFDPTSAIDGTVGYRFYINRWLGVEGDYDLFRNSQKYISSTSTTRVPTNVGAATAAVVVNIPNPLTKRFTSFISAGASEMLFYQHDTPGIDRQLKNAIMIGGGVDFPVSRHIAIRVQDKSFLYKAPDFKVADLHTNKYVETMIPSAGLVFSF